MSSQFEHISSQKRYVSVRAILETGMILAGVVATLFLLPRRGFYDGDVRFNAMANLIEHGSISNMSYSIVGPAFSLPLLLLGKLYKSLFWWSGKYNKLVFFAGLLFIYLLLKDRVDRGLVRKFLLVLIVASMFSNALTFYGGEVFTAICVGVGIIAVISGPSLYGWIAIILGVVNTPASVAGLSLITLKHILNTRRLKYLLPLIISGVLIMAEAWWRRGSPFDSGYKNQTFSTPFLLGLLSILFSFGKGLIFFTPGLLLPIKDSLNKIQKRVKGNEWNFYAVYSFWMNFLIGLIIIYSSWWAWDGGWFWGPRFFLFASIPASFALAVRLHHTRTELRFNLLTLIVFCLSVWVAIDGAIFDQDTLAKVCVANHFAQNYLCQYVPAFSVLWRPFMVYESLNRTQMFYIAYSMIVALYLAAPILKVTVQQIVEILQNIISMNLRLSGWYDLKWHDIQLEKSLASSQSPDNDETLPRMFTNDLDK